MTSGLARQGGGVAVALFPALRTWWWREFRDAAGTLLSILSIFILSTGLFFDFFKTGEDLCRKLVVAIAV